MFSFVLFLFWYTSPCVDFAATAHFGNVFYKIIKETFLLWIT